MSSDVHQKIFTSNLNYYIQRSGKTQREIADSIGVSPQTFNTWCKGIAIPRMIKIQALADYFKISKSDLIDKHSSQVSTSSGISIPIVKKLIPGIPSDAYEDISGYEEISHALAKKGDFVCIKVTDSAMSPIIQEQDIVIIQIQSYVENGDIAAVQTANNETILRKVQKSADGISLIAYNLAISAPHFYSNKEIKNSPIEIAGKVVELKRSF